MSYIRIELEVACYRTGLSDDAFHHLIETEVRTPPVNSMQVKGPIVERLKCVSALLLGLDTVGIERLWEVVDVLKLDKNWRN